MSSYEVVIDDSIVLSIKTTVQNPILIDDIAYMEHQDLLLDQQVNVANVPKLERQNDLQCNQKIKTSVESGQRTQSHAENVSSTGFTYVDSDGKHTYTIYMYISTLA